MSKRSKPGVAANQSVEKQSAGCRALTPVAGWTCTHRHVDTH